ncbi:SMP-30/gluconolactonase/LRE family protein [Akkermansiaceae bacterium]|nr:SMP-30/gluconolactonase/LRE family protein [Akkermansiaceae bacterium]MDB4318526.1 SMP-30/gluconolactonase/LRE family protein [bacterium]MDA7535823.1 SMP-30/gluconolactonase/LRE family protein [Akkermansiaceae bacterium]MDA7876697.1 SMP-30/gluconolactonase/LRE family protein [Akkermansiaceae bacterium]MDB4271457.1 SMP-30/gluconolactonase/LRE family protein [Akkermansiaceae bacterium]
MHYLGILLLLIGSLFGKGTLTKHQFRDSKIFPGTERDYWIYVPAQYDGSTPACLMVFQDGGGFVRNPGKVGYVPDVFDELIESGEMPVTIGLFINPGVVPAANKGAQPRFNRSLEYDGMGPDYANFLIEEMIPRLNLKISLNPDDRALCGASSGAIAAFTAAWERPDHFRRVYSMIGTYVGLRGGNDYPALIRKTEPKPLRIFLQDGKNDLNIYGGDWWMANQTMQRALEFSGYEHTHRWDEGKHSREEGNKLLPEALRWLWKDHGTKPVSTHPENCKSRASEWLIPGEDWQVVSEGHNWSEGLAIAEDGTLYFTDVPDSELFKITSDGKETLVAKETNRANGIALGPHGKKLYTASSKQIRAYDLATGSHEVIDEGVGANDIVVSNSGHLFFTDPAQGKVWHIDLKTRKRTQAATVKGLNGIGMSADQTLLYVCQFAGPFIHSFSIQPDGSLTNQQPYFYAQLPTSAKAAALDGQCTAASGHLLVGTEAGLQIFDQPGRVQLVLPRPAYEDGRVNYCALHGDILYIATRHRIYKRKVKLQAAPAWKSAVKPPKPRL